MSTEARLAVIEQQLADGKEKMNSMETKIDGLADTMSKQRGFIAGFSAAFSMLATALIGLVVYIWQTHFKG